ncbi:hypothetical protein NE237_008224 [Protea cynaroides]|uniref:Uncharacterized protein n=1 Tax=Protea cynaroides TaxID=273540 RepID=A0A9Q0KQZ3_9MAGN|nr:hypothetical protein NE237_008224 [Protea cynaroides]
MRGRRREGKCRRRRLSEEEEERKTSKMLKQILEALQLKGLLHSKTDGTDRVALSSVSCVYRKKNRVELGCPSDSSHLCVFSVSDNNSNVVRPIPLLGPPMLRPRKWVKGISK